jgi:ABC-2 type transport system permease protein
VSSIVLVLFAFAVFGLRFDVGPAGVGLALLAFVMALAGFAALGIAYAAWVMVFKKGDSLMAFAATGISLLSGVYFPIKLFPGPVRWLAELLPITQGNTALRSILLTGAMPWARVGALALTAAVLLPLSLVLLNRALHRARQAGTVGQF